MPTVHDQPAPTIYHVPQLPPQEDAAKYIADLFAHGGDNTTVLLEQGASYNLFSMIALSGHHQELATEGYPTDNVLKARLFTRGKDEAGAVRGVNKRYQAVRNVLVVEIKLICSCECQLNPSSLIPAQSMAVEPTMAGCRAELRLFP